MKVRISEIFERAVQRHLRTNVETVPEGFGLLLQAHMRYSAYKDDKSAEMEFQVHILATMGRPNVRIHFAQSTKPVPPYEMNKLKWKETACHDSAWRQDGISTPLNEADRRIRETIARYVGVEPEDVHCHVWADDAMFEGSVVPVDMKPIRHADPGARKPVLRKGPIRSL